MTMLKRKRKPHTHNHQCAGLQVISQSPANRTIESMIAEITRDFTKSASHNLKVMVLKPYLFSMEKVRYRLNGMPRNSPAYDKSRKKSQPEIRNERLRVVIHEL